jgi:hypothetical protein
VADGVDTRHSEQNAARIGEPGDCHQKLADSRRVIESDASGGHDSAFWAAARAADPASAPPA